MLRFLKSLLTGIARNHGVGDLELSSTPSTPPTSEPKPPSSEDPSASPVFTVVIDEPFDRGRMISQLRLHEGERLKPYRCTAGRLTIGVGRNLEDRGITREESAHLLSNDIDGFYAGLLSRAPWISDLDEVRQRVLLDMAFNLGLEGLMSFRRTLAAVRAGEYQRAASMMLDSRWATQVGARAKRLSDMMWTGQDSRDF